MDIKLVPMTEGDIDAVLEIEKLSFPTPWTRRLFLNELANPNSQIVLAKDDVDAILGYICFWTVADETHIMNLAVHPEFRKQGVGKQLFAFALEFSEARGIVYFALEVRERNNTALEFYKRFGFKVAGIRKGYYRDTGEDAVLMELEL